VLIIFIFLINNMVIEDNILYNCFPVRKKTVIMN